MYKCHKLKDEQFKIGGNNISLDQVKRWKPLGVAFDEKLTLNTHITELFKNCYSYLSILKKTQNIYFSVGKLATSRIFELYKVCIPGTVYSSISLNTR